MHYKNGREAHVGDEVIFLPDRESKKTCNEPVRTGILYGIVSGADGCNGRLATPRCDDPCITIGQSLLASDVYDRVQLDGVTKDLFK